MSPEPADNNDRLSYYEEEELADNNSSVSDGASTGQASSGSPSGNGSSSYTNNKPSSLPEDLIARNESRHVCWLRTLVVVTLLIAGILTCVGMFYASRQSEQRHFELQFEDNAWSVVDALHNHFLRGIGVVDNAFLAGIDNATLPYWPTLVFPDYEATSSSIRNLGLFHTLGISMVVSRQERPLWEGFANAYSGAWIQAGLAYEEQIGADDWHFGQLDRVTNTARHEGHHDGHHDNKHLEDEEHHEDDMMMADSHHEGHRKLVEEEQEESHNSIMDTAISPTIYEVDPQDPSKIIPAPQDAEEYYAWWQGSPIDPGLVNYNLKSHASMGPEADRTLETRAVLVGKSFYWDPPATKKHDFYPTSPSFPIFFPLALGEERLAVLTVLTTWEAYLQVGTEMVENSNGMHLMVLNDCGQQFHFEVQDEVVQYVGHNHRDGYDDMAIEWQLTEELSHLTMFSGMPLDLDYCPYRVIIYPTPTMRDHFYTNGPILYTCLVAAVFLFTALVFLGYDYMVERRQQTVMKSAVKSHTIVSSLFPKTVRQRLFGEEEETKKKKESPGGGMLQNQKAKLRSFISGHEEPEAASASYGGGKSTVTGVLDVKKSKPIADLFPSTTVLFADIANFTAWASTREPANVFTLLETLYGAFDKLADRHHIFKVETIGDCYVAATGVPDAQADHATRMAKFADQIMQQMRQVTRDLEVELGPDTTELSLRIGLHSGPVTAGVLRGQKSRFQLFGDTVNTAARMESNGLPDRIQCSQATADLLIDGGKQHWLASREDKVHAKGKGEIQTYWVLVGSRKSESRSGRKSSIGEDTTLGDTSSSEGGGDIGTPIVGSKKKHVANLERLVDWHVDLLARLLKGILARRRFMTERSSTGKPSPCAAAADLASGKLDQDGNPRDLYAPVILLPRFDQASNVPASWSADDIVLDPIVLDQLRDYVTKVALAYNSTNPFHNFDHASHVTMAANKTLKRIVEAADLDFTSSDVHNPAAKLHDYSFGITSDPLTHFACVFSALIHDLDHPGVPNFQLVKEGDEMAKLYDNKSVAEQNSIDLAWEMLNESYYRELREALFATPQEKSRFRQLVVNSVMATDIFDPQLKAMREDRWKRAFASDSGDCVDLKATIVIEHIIQAADIAHTMQHWHVYQKWNRRFFHEMYRAWVYGRSEKDPSLGWYQGELWFYDNYIIPLAKKLKECGVFGVSSDEFLNYATMNRSEWSSRGEAIVEELKREVQAKYGGRGNQAGRPSSSGSLLSNENSACDDTIGGESGIDSLDVQKEKISED